MAATQPTQQRAPICIEFDADPDRSGCAVGVLVGEALSKLARGTPELAAIVTRAILGNALLRVEIECFICGARDANDSWVNGRIELRFARELKFLEVPTELNFFAPYKCRLSVWLSQ